MALDLNAAFADQANIITAPPADAAGTPGLATGWFSAKHHKKVTIVLIRNAGGAGEAPTITVQQATAVAGTGAKNLAAVTRIHTKEHASAVAGIGTWTVATQAAAATYAATAAVQGIYAIDIDTSLMDIAGGFDCLQATVADVGATANQAILMAILWGTRYEPPLSPLVD